MQNCRSRAEEIGENRNGESGGENGERPERDFTRQDKETSGKTKGTRNRAWLWSVWEGKISKEKRKKKSQGKGISHAHRRTQASLQEHYTHSHAHHVEHEGEAKIQAREGKISRENRSRGAQNEICQEIEENQSGQALTNAMWTDNKRETSLRAWPTKQKDSDRGEKSTLGSENESTAKGKSKRLHPGGKVPTGICRTRIAEQSPRSINNREKTTSTKIRCKNNFLIKIKRDYNFEIERSLLLI
jgi:hypothetical protein